MSVPQIDYSHTHKCMHVCMYVYTCANFVCVRLCVYVGTSLCPGVGVFSGGCRMQICCQHPRVWMRPESNSRSEKRILQML